MKAAHVSSQEPGMNPRASWEMIQGLWDMELNAKTMNALEMGYDRNPIARTR